MLVENTLFGVKDKVKIAIDRLRTFEPPEGIIWPSAEGKIVNVYTILPKRRA